MVCSHLLGERRVVGRGRRARRRRSSASSSRVRASVTASCGVGRGRRRCAAIRRASGAPRRRRSLRPWRGEDAARRSRTRSRRSARGRSCRTGSPRSAAARCGNSIVTTPSGFSSSLHAGDEVVEVGHLGQHVVADQQVGAVPLAARAGSRARRAEELDERRRPRCSTRAFGDVGGRLDAEHRNAVLDEVLQQVAVVARELDDQRLLGAEAEARR